jgi:AraC family transcriptional regulator, transcriptional activator of the genes for pyochelin and ferripyochelin receptors
MTIHLSMTDYWELFEEQDTNESIISDEFEEILSQFPQILGQGYMRQITISDGLWLKTFNYQLKDDLSLQMPVREHVIEFGIQISGCFWTDDGVGIKVNPQESCLYGSGIASKGISNWRGGEQYLGLDVHVEPELLKVFFSDSSGQVPPELQLLIKENDWQKCFSGLKVTPAMQVVAQQILNCPYQGFTKQMYLQSKVFELLALHLEQLQPSNKNQNSIEKLKPGDIERIHQAKKILIARSHNPPSLLELSREVGLNDFKLKIGFRHCFGTTVFGCLHQYRMEQAQKLLEQGNLTITGCWLCKPQSFCCCFQT